MTSWKTVSETFESVKETIDKSNKLNNKYKDSVEDVMLDNTDNSSD